MIAVRNANVTLAELLLERGADIEFKDEVIPPEHEYLLKNALLFFICENSGNGWDGRLSTRKVG